MKKILLLIACVAMFLPSIGQENKHEQIVEIQSSKSNLFANAQQWSTSDMAGVTKQLETSNNETGTVLVNISALYNPMYFDYTFKFNIKIDCRDNKYRTIISNPVVYIKINSRYSNFDYLAQSTLVTLRDKLGAVKDLSTYDFKGIVAWNIDDIQPILSKKEEKALVLKAEKDKLDVKKNKKEIKSIEYGLKPLEQQTLILSEILRAWEQCEKDVFTSIEKAMSKKDDF